MSVLEFISSLKWPVVVLVALLVVSRALRRSPGLGEWARSWLDKRDVRGKVGPAEFEATASQAQAAAQIAAASDEELAAIAAAEPQQEALDPEWASRPDLSVMRRESVESLLRASAQWGWEIAQMGFRTPPDPQVRWTDDGRPEIVYGGTPITRALVVPSSWALTPDEVRRRAAAAGEPQMSDAARQAAVQRRLDELRHGERDGE